VGNVLVGGAGKTPTVIAIPALMFYRYFRGLVEAYTLEMEQASDRLVPHLMRFAVPRGG
jgi:biopolymer transport protein ExbB